MSWFWTGVCGFLFLTAMSGLGWSLVKIGQYEAAFESEYSRVKKRVDTLEITASNYRKLMEELQSLYRMRRANKKKVEVLVTSFTKRFTGSPLLKV